MAKDSATAHHFPSFFTAFPQPKIAEFPKTFAVFRRVGPKIFWVLLGTFGCNCNLTIDGEAQGHNRIIKDSFHANANGYWSQATSFEAGGEILLFSSHA